MIITREMVEQRLVALRGQHDKTMNDMQALWGAIQEAELWLKIVNEEKQNVSNSTGSSADNGSAGTPEDSSNDTDNG